MKAMCGFDWRNWLKYLSVYDAVCYTSDKASKPRRLSAVIGYPTGFV